jgi:hypothetical protein
LRNEGDINKGNGGSAGDVRLASIGNNLDFVSWFVPFITDSMTLQAPQHKHGSQSGLHPAE